MNSAKFKIAHHNVVCMGSPKGHALVTGDNSCELWAESTREGIKLSFTFNGNEWMVTDVDKGLAGSCLTFKLKDAKSNDTAYVYTDTPVDGETTPERIRGMAYEAVCRSDSRKVDFMLAYYRKALKSFGGVDSELFDECDARGCTCSGA